MQFSWTPVFVAFYLTGIQGFRLPGKEFIPFGDQTDDVSDSSSDLIISPPEEPPIPDEGFLEEDPLNDVVPLFQDSKIYGMNIGLHFILGDIIRRLATRDKVPLESLIKVLVLTHNIEKVGGTIDESNMMALRSASRLYPVSLREAMGPNVAEMQGDTSLL